MARKSKELPLKVKSKIPLSNGFNGKGAKPKQKLQYRLLVEGICERKYFKKLLSIPSDNIKGGNNYNDSLSTAKLDDVEEYIEEGLDMGLKCIYVVDLDRIYIDKFLKEKLAFQKLRNKYAGKDVVFCDSMPSFEFWLLLHFDKYKMHPFYTETGADESDLKKYIPNYQKSKVDTYEHLYLPENLQGAIDRAKRIDYSDDEARSHSNVWKAIEELK